MGLCIAVYVFEKVSARIGAQSPVALARSGTGCNLVSHLPSDNLSSRHKHKASLVCPLFSNFGRESPSRLSRKGS